jgi:predicted neuraminidase
MKRSRNVLKIAVATLVACAAPVVAQEFDEGVPATLPASTYVDPHMPFERALKLTGQADHPAIVSVGFTYDKTSYPQCHASTLVETTDGTLLGAWFGGTRERAPDVGIWVARFENGRWQPAVEVADGAGLGEGGKDLPTWNPVLFQPKNGPLVLFYKLGPSPSAWWGMMTTSTDGGRTWAKPTRLPDGILGPIKNKPVELADGTWLCPSSKEGSGGWRTVFERTSDGGKTWTSTDPVPAGEQKVGAIQPSLLTYADGALQALCRTRSGFVGSTWSRDGGATWTPFESAGLPNPNSGTDAVTLADGRQLLVYNHSIPNEPADKPTKGPRFPIDVAISDDGKTWRRVLTLETTPISSGYAYPAVIQTRDGKVHISYTWSRIRIKHVVIDPSKL